MGEWICGSCGSKWDEAQRICKNCWKGLPPKDDWKDRAEKAEAKLASLERVVAAAREQDKGYFDGAGWNPDDPEDTAALTHQGDRQLALHRALAALDSALPSPVDPAGGES